MSAADLRAFDDQGAAFAQLGVSLEQELFFLVEFQVQNVARLGFTSRINMQPEKFAGCKPVFLAFLECLLLLADHLELSAPAPDNSATREFMHAVNRLSAEHRQILLLVSLEELSYREIAGELDIPMGTVMSRLARARNELKAYLEGERPSLRRVK